MPRNCPVAFLIEKSPPSRHVRRIAGDHIKRGRRENPVSLLNIPLYNPHGIFNSVEQCGPSGHIHVHFINFQPAEHFSPALCLQQNGDHAISGAKIQHLFSGLNHSKRR